VRHYGSNAVVLIAIVLTVVSVTTIVMRMLMVELVAIIVAMIPMRMVMPTITIVVSVAVPMPKSVYNIATARVEVVLAQE